ncbi:hypothetical protein ACFL3J_01420 [Candidatus Omnitrophota bacterium]
MIKSLLLVVLIAAFAATPLSLSWGEDITLTTIIPAGGEGVPSGGIIIWSGAEADIPTGWVLCDGSNSTPDLRSRFIAGAGTGGSYSVGDTGGKTSHALTISEMPAHNHGSSGNHRHTLKSDTNGAFGTNNPDGWLNQGGTTLGRTEYAGNHTHTTQGSGNAHENRPPYYALCYIMRQ